MCDEQLNRACVKCYIHPFDIISINSLELLSMAALWMVLADFHVAIFMPPSCLLVSLLLIV